MPPESVMTLVVDDDPVFRVTLSARLRAWGYDPVLAADVDSALRVCRRAQPEVVITDVVLPGRSGLDLLRELKSDEPAPAVILITAHGGVREAVEALRAGAQDFLTKPLDIGKLKRVLEEVTSRSGGESPGEGGGAGRLPLGLRARQAERLLMAEAMDSARGDEDEAARLLDLWISELRTKLAGHREADRD